MASEKILEDMPAPEIPWVKVTPTKTRYRIRDVAFVAGKFGKRDTILVLADPSSLSTYRMTVWGGNYAWLYNTFGPNKADWIDKDISVWLDGKTRYVGYAE